MSLELRTAHDQAWHDLWDAMTNDDPDMDIELLEQQQESLFLAWWDSLTHAERQVEMRNARETYIEELL